MSGLRRKPQILKATMRTFRAAPAKLLRRAARTGAKLKLGELLLVVREGREGPLPQLYGSMSADGRLVGAASGLLSANDTWSADGQ